MRRCRARRTVDEGQSTELHATFDIRSGGRPAETQEELRHFFDEYGSLIVEPYRQSSFDFGDPAFRDRLQDCFEQASHLRAATGSPHFIFLNKALVGLLNLLTRLEARVDTTESLSLLNESLEGLGCAAVER